MCSPWHFCTLIVFFWLCSSPPVVAGRRGSSSGGGKWQTLTGNPPLVIARGGFSGIFPDSSLYAYQFDVLTGLSNSLAWCDVYLTKDGSGICFPELRLENASNIGEVYGDKHNTYTVNGVSVEGWFALDFTLDDLAYVHLRRRIDARSDKFDSTASSIQSVDNVVNKANPVGLWLNIPYDEFYSQHNLSMRSFVISATRRMNVSYISSPEVGFLRSTLSQFRTGSTKLIFQFLGPNDIELSTNQTYSSLTKNLTFIKTFASGILVPKSYIWVVDSGLYLQNYTSLVLDAHKAGLQIFASNFANDAFMAYNYSYDPVAEYLSFIDNGLFSVDGVLSDFPITASSTIDCHSHIAKNETAQVELLIISSEGASGDYPGCTDKAYAKAVSDGVDILDCPVQITNDGIPFCLGSINLIDKSNAVESIFSNMATTNPDLNIRDGIFAYNLTWSQIQTLKPAISNPYSNYSLFRNPRARNDGKFMQLTDFLAFANNSSSVKGVLISIENAAYLAEKQGLGVTDAVLNALRKSGHNNQTSKKIMIKSSDSAVLEKFKSSGNYELVYLVDEDISDILNSTIVEIKEFATAVVISKRSVFPTDEAYMTGQTSVVPKIHAFNLPVYVQIFQNEFVAQAWDFFSDAYLEMLNYVDAMNINGVVTDYPATAAKFKRNRCLGYKNRPPYMTPVPPGGLIGLMAPGSLPAEAPYPVLTGDDVAEPPLPAVIERSDGNGSTAPAPRNGQAILIPSITTTLSTIAASIAISIIF
ncbi:hypothetical protein ACP275_13G104000 [Erythranthe tilingii]